MNLPKRIRKRNENTNNINNLQLTQSEKILIDNNKFSEYFQNYKSSCSKQNFFLTSNQKIDQNDDKLIINHQVVFLFDITGSMKSIINSVKAEIVPVIKRLKENATIEVTKMMNSNLFVINFYVSVIGYRDFSDDRHFETFDFTVDIREIEDFLGTLEAMGGGDQPEDVKGAFIHALFRISDISKKLSWKDDVASKSIYLITDAPAHGKNFNNCGYVTHLSI